MTRILLSGYFGFNNLGDEAILASMVKMINNQVPELKVTVLTDKVEETKKKYDTETVYRYNLFEIAAEMRRGDIFISGGGSLLQDVTGIKSIPYYLGLIFLAQLFGMKTIFFAQGVGPINSNFYRFLIKKVLKNVDFLSVRDLDSKLLLEEIGIDKKQIQIIDDPVYGLNTRKDYKNIDKKKVGVAVRSWKDDKYLESLADFLNYLIKKEEVIITIIPFHKDEDIDVGYRLKKMLYTDPEIKEYSDDLAEINNLFSSFDIFVGVRLHSLIFSAINCTPFIAISYDPKVESLIKEMNYQPMITTENITKDKLIKSYMIIRENRTEIKKRINRIVEDKNRRVRNSITQLISDLKGE